jgi:stage V sporulation protein SpoVS
MANQTVMYTSSKGDLDIDEMDEGHLRNVLKKLIKDGVAPKGEVVVDKVDVVNVNKALKALAVAKSNIAMMGLSATDEGESFWQANIELMTEVEISLSAQLKTITAK